MRFSGAVKIVVWLALVALLGQLAASFGHLHAARQAVVARVELGENLAAAPDGSGSPTLGGTDRNCQVCWTTALSGTGLLPAGLVVDTTFRYLRSEQRPAAFVPRAILAGVSFQARPPPVGITI